MTFNVIIPPPWRMRYASGRVHSLTTFIALNRCVEIPFLASRHALHCRIWKARKDLGLHPISYLRSFGHVMYQKSVGASRRCGRESRLLHFSHIDQKLRLFLKNEIQREQQTNTRREYRLCVRGSGQIFLGGLACCSRGRVQSVIVQIS